MKIGFDVSQTGANKAGCGFFAENLITQLFLLDKTNQYYLYPTFGDHFWDNNYQSTVRFNSANFHQGLTHQSHGEARKFWAQLNHDWEKQLGEVDIIHANNFFCLPKPINSKLVYTLYDLSFIANPECTTEANRISCFNGVFNASTNADFIIAISDYTRKHFLETFPHYPEDKIRVIYPASRFNDSESIHQSSKLQHLAPQKFWLNVGTLEPRKNILRLLSAYAKLKATHQHTYPLVLAGGQGWLMDNINQIIRDNNLENHVHILGYVDNDDLQWLYKNCFCFVYPSLFEGFGLPVLEAMTLGGPIITSNTTSIPEIAHDASLLINPLREDDIFDAMQEINSKPQLRNDLIDKGKKRAQHFSWNTAGKAVLEVYKELIPDCESID